jgi:hypothetical protein
MRSSSSLVAVLVLAACGGGGGGRRDDETSRKLAEASRRCPVAELDAAIVVEDLPDGAVITFTTGGQPQRLRAKVFAIADTHNEVHVGDASAPDTTRGDATLAAVHSRARPEEVPGGARIVVVAEPADVEELRDELRDRADEIASACEIP